MRSIVAVVLGLIVAAQASAQPSVDFTGRVFDAGTKTGIQNLQVKLLPPRQSKNPPRIANTDRDGVFVFRKVPQGRYLVEVSQGVTLLYRAEVNTATTSRLDVPLRRK
jgi:hypothetical protein